MYDEKGIQNNKKDPINLAVNSALNSAEEVIKKEPLILNYIERKINMKLKQAKLEKEVAFNSTAKQMLNDDSKNLNNELNFISEIEKEGEEKQLRLLKSIKGKIKKLEVSIILYII